MARGTTVGTWAVIELASGRRVDTIDGQRVAEVLLQHHLAQKRVSRVRDLASFLEEVRDKRVGGFIARAPVTYQKLS